MRISDWSSDVCSSDLAAAVPAAVILIHLAFLILVVVFAHHPPVFMGLLLFFLGFATAYQRHQNPLLLREALLVAFFLAGLVVLGGLPPWWLEPLRLGLDANRPEEGGDGQGGAGTVES